MSIEPVGRIWMDGEMVDWEDANVHVLTHGLHYGSSVFEGIRAYGTVRGPAVFRLTDHLRRLERSAAVYMIEMPYVLRDLVAATKELLRVNGLNDCYIRPLVFRGSGSLGLNPLEVPVRVAIAAWPWGAYLGEAGLENGIRATVSSWRRPGPSMLPAGAKAGGHYLNCQLAVIEAVRAGYQEALMLSPEGLVAEGAGENVFLVRDGVLLTPPPSAGILPGITRDSVLRIAVDLGYDVRESHVAPGDLFTAEEVFLTGTAAEVCPVREVDGRVIGKGKRGPITTRIQATFFAATRGELPRYWPWNELVGGREVAAGV